MWANLIIHTLRACVRSVRIATHRLLIESVMYIGIVKVADGLMIVFEKSKLL